ncbi:hypothetical protein HAX54_033372 [Datura stramonium]|uniref:Uncharacterized protein n=1 Tax=Datura stramonium TaxID=4076 RepID=A0ABS8VFK8_DATST|nr:hypothetical protein [Datura stramonium]
MGAFPAYCEREKGDENWFAGCSMAGFGREENERGEGGAAARAVVVVAREMKKKEGKKGVKRLPAVICHRKIWGEGREGGLAMREKSYGGYSVLRLGGSGVRRNEREEERGSHLIWKQRRLACNYGGGDAGFLTKKVRGGQFGSFPVGGGGVRRRLVWTTWGRGRRRLEEVRSQVVEARKKVAGVNGGWRPREKGEREGKRRPEL